MIRGIHHVALNTGDFRKMLTFYRDILGFETIYERDWENDQACDAVVDLKDSAAQVAIMRAGNAYLELFQYRKPASRNAAPLRPCDRGYTHFCLEVSDIDQEWERLSQSGMTFSRRPVDFGDVKAIYGKDPDGNVIELQEVLDRNHPISFDSLAAKLGR